MKTILVNKLCPSGMTMWTVYMKWRKPCMYTVDILKIWNNEGERITSEIWPSRQWTMWRKIYVGKNNEDMKKMKEEGEIIMYEWWKAVTIIA